MVGTRYSLEWEMGRQTLTIPHWKRVSQSILVRRHFTIAETVTVPPSPFLSGAQLKSSHNIRLLCGNPLTLCRQKTAGVQGGIMANPERLQTAMSLYSTKLSCMILTVDGRLGQQSGIEHSKTVCSWLSNTLPPFLPPFLEFAEICQQTTDFHFPDYAEQLSAVMECAVQANERRGQQQQGAGGLDSSYSSQTSDPATPQGGSPFNNERVPPGGADFSGHHNLSPLTTPRYERDTAASPSDLDPQSVILEPGIYNIVIKLPPLTLMPTLQGTSSSHAILTCLKCT